MTRPNEMALVMPMAGRGSRFVARGLAQPKPLIELHGRPFFWWAVESVRRQLPLRELVFVVLEEHVRAFAIDACIHQFYPGARVVVIADVTAGAAATALVGLSALNQPGPVAVNDCDHAFICEGLAALATRLGAACDGALMCFSSQSPVYSYAHVDAVTSLVTATVEKRVISPFAIAGCYFLADSSAFKALYEGYLNNCPYDELFMSGIFNRMIGSGAAVCKVDVARHFSFGTPDEWDAVRASGFEDFLAWR